MSYFPYLWSTVKKEPQTATTFRILQEPKQSILKRQRNIVAAKLYSQYESSGAFSKAELAAFDMYLENFDLNKQLQNFQVKEYPDADALQAFFSFGAGIRKVNKEKIKDADQRLSLIDEALDSLVSAVANSSNILNAIYFYALSNYKESQMLAGESEAFQIAIKTIQSLPENTIQEIKKTGASLETLKPSVRKFLIKIAALGSEISVDSAKAIKRDLAKIASGALNDIAGGISEIAMANQQMMNSDMEYALQQKCDNTVKQSLRSISNTTSINKGFSHIQVKANFDDTVLNMYKNIANTNETKTNIGFQGKKTVIFSKIEPKSDVLFEGTVKGEIDSIGGALVKTSNRVTADSLEIKDMKLQDSTPLFTLLVREIGMSGKTVENLMHILASHGVRNERDSGFVARPEVDKLYQDLKEYVAYASFANTLLGYDLANTPLVIIINNTPIPMYTFVNYVIQGINDKEIYGFHAKGMPNGTSQFQAANQWIGSNRPNLDIAQARSNAANIAVLNTLYDIKITIRLSLTDLTVFYKS